MLLLLAGGSIAALASRRGTLAGDKSGRFRWIEVGLAVVFGVATMVLAFYGIRQSSQSNQIASDQYELQFQTSWVFELQPDTTTFSEPEGALVTIEGSSQDSMVVQVRLGQDRRLSHNNEGTLLTLQPSNPNVVVNSARIVLNEGWVAPATTREQRQRIERFGTKVQFDSSRATAHISNGDANLSALQYYAAVHSFEHFGASHSGLTSTISDGHGIETQFIGTFESPATLAVDYYVLGRQESRHVVLILSWEVRESYNVTLDTYSVAGHDEWRIRYAKPVAVRVVSDFADQAEARHAFDELLRQEASDHPGSVLTAF